MKMSKRMQRFRNILYEARIMAMNLHFLERCRLRRKQIKSFKWCRDYNKGDISKVLRVNNQDRNRNNRFKLKKNRRNRKKYEGTSFQIG